MDRKFNEKFKDVGLPAGYTLNDMGQLERLPRKSWDEYFLDLADMVATRSTCNRAHHGAVLVDSNHRIVSTGYNGSAPGQSHCEDVGCEVVDNHCIRTKGRHAEDNVIDYILSFEDWHGFFYDNLTLYVTANPCSLCQKKIKDIEEIDCVVYRNSYYDGRFRPIGIHKLYP